MAIRRLTGLSVLVSFFLGTGFASAESPSSWKSVKNSEGIHVSIQEVEGRDLPVFRGVGDVHADYWDVLAVLVAVENRVDWAHKCMETRVVRDEGARGRIIYDRVDSPWPVSDRDVVVRSRMDVDPGQKRVHITFVQVVDCDAPEVEDVVRMPRMKGHYVLVGTSHGKTSVEYQIDADPGGMLPNWLIDLASREIPFETLRGLRKQVSAVKNTAEHVALRETIKAKYAGVNPSNWTR